MKVGLIGLGAMGSGIALNLCKAGFEGLVTRMAMAEGMTFGVKAKKALARECRHRR
jgi:3-hydroxyisobutyrate dehydrogenase-like beta-hydroxyacid dehydrogenase